MLESSEVKKNKKEHWSLKMTNPALVAGALNVQRSGHEEATEVGKDPTMKRLEAPLGHGFS